ncbi:T9SS type A sorting domain-containing protein, partial [Rhodohalobacter sp. 8-1]|uniref:T9SS type A sorting domain-containing protein n=1 Tax=Rhodohalobacter sp. 8-1 TaxID=3131972 RepID=UPI0030EC2BAF
GQQDPVCEDEGGEDSGSDNTSAGAPELYAPARQGVDVSVTPSFEWSDTGADYYMLQIGTAGNVIDIMVEGISITLTDSLAYDSSYEWRVRGVTGNTEGEWSSLWQYTTEQSYEEVVALHAPEQVSPVYGQVDNTPTFEWTAVEGADHYILHSNRIDPAEMVIDEAVVGTTFTPKETLKPGTVYHWRVRAVADTVEGEWSEIWEFTTESDQEVETIRETDLLPIRTGLNQNYPNPFNPSTQIEYTLTDMQRVSLRVYDMAGRQIAVLADGVKHAGRHMATFSAKNLASGIYFYRLITDSKVYTKKMTLVK